MIIIKLNLQSTTDQWWWERWCHRVWYRWSDPAWQSLIIMIINIILGLPFDHHHQPDNHYLGHHHHPDHQPDHYHQHNHRPNPPHQHPTLLPSLPGPPPPHLQQIPVSNSLVQSIWIPNALLMMIVIIMIMMILIMMMQAPHKNQSDGENSSNDEIPRHHWLPRTTWFWYWWHCVIIIHATNHHHRRHHCDINHETGDPPLPMCNMLRN